MNLEVLATDAIDLLRRLIATPSYSKQEDQTAQLLLDYFNSCGLVPQQHLNNVFCISKNCTPNSPVVLLNSHHDTVQFGDGWTHDPFGAEIENDQLFGLGSNDAGASVVSLIQTFRYLSSLPNLPYQLIVAISAEEEISGKQGIEALLPVLPKIDFGIVGEPTEMKLAVAERGLMVLDVVVTGKTGHAARNEGINAIYLANQDINWFESYSFPEESDFLGPIKLSVTQIEAGIQHNVVPDKCSYVVDCRLNDTLSHEELLARIEQHIQGNATARSMRLKPSKINLNHPFVQVAKKQGIDLFGSATMSDQALMPFDTVKIGPGKSERSHMSDEFIYLSEIKQGIEIYIKLLSQLTV